MCGIHLQIGLRNSSQIWSTVDAETISALRARGPDYCHEGHVNLDHRIRIEYIATVLSLREPFQIQPVTEPESSNRTGLLLWNGEAWKIDEAVVTGNDSRVVYDRLQRAALADSQDWRPLQERTSHVINALHAIQGPFAFVFIDSLNQRVYMSRDALGRRSLLVKCTPDSLAISSVNFARSEDAWVELDANNVFALELPSSPLEMPEGISIAPWKHIHNFTKSTGLTLVMYPHHVHGATKLNRSMPPAGISPQLSLKSAAVLQLETLLSNALAIRVRNIYLGPLAENVPEDSVCVAVLFSGGLDCTVLARLLHEHLPAGMPVDLLNVAFENPRKARLKLDNQAEPVTADVPTISLSGKAIITGLSYEECPDRITAETAHAELRQVCPGRDWRLVKINIPYALAVEHRENVKRLIYPRATVMDLDIGRALYFASRGNGHVQFSDDGPLQPYTSRARVMLSGLGADELFGGYQHHARSFFQQGYSGLFDSLESDIDRIADRNLGRDDRVLSHWGRETRFPYLDEEVVAWAKHTPVWDKCGYRERENGYVENSQGLNDDKLVLRLLAVKLGMRKTAAQPKRAIQFGARTAKMDNGKARGTDII